MDWTEDSINSLVSHIFPQIPEVHEKINASDPENDSITLSIDVSEDPDYITLSSNSISIAPPIDTACG